MTGLGRVRSWSNDEGWVSSTLWPPRATGPERRHNR